ncbi:hypothetical protein PUNSTDRAFT_118834 [Punctularia strigosozonata HHB-11173 SS5]|uniref:uncharacterized protein n=1 Tax=Punctularia strigosozonata (strain HHB-11173) TaxID=741275 RepID=UPI00044169FD|nr:uncharacterized protein PUNSTDRAFT_118834 [Punctularia strigosozonata HHB-11173 SS5]EIN11438.1 hypothetical protein PUNSTDRAFT_118834 [Punctularia strigosozonata HHB-11173 SS5]
MSTVEKGELPVELVVSIHRILDGPEDTTRSSDPLDALSSAELNPVDVLNEYFPDEASLAQLGAVQARLQQQEEDVLREIDELMVELRRGQDPNRMQLIQEMISDLLGQMSRIREKATESEAVVRNITKDIQVLDLAKKNLILSMTTLKRLQMLVNALTQLEDLVKERKYADIAETLSAVKQISASFKGYTAVPHIAQIWRRIQELQGRIRTLLDADFDAFYMQDTSRPGQMVKPAQIASACLVVDVLGPDVRAHFVDRYVTLELKDYRRIFRISPASTAGSSKAAATSEENEAAGLDNISRRFAWFRRLLATHDQEVARVFPPEWHVGWALVTRFADITRDDMATLLAKGEASKSLPVSLLLETLQQTLEFEASMAKKYATPFVDILKSSSPAMTKPVMPISTAWEAHLGVFVEAQDKALADMLAPHRASLNKGPPRSSLDAPSSGRPSLEDAEETEARVLPSSTELFYFYAQSLEQCAKLSTGQPLYDLCQVHKRWLRTYAEDVLIPTIKRPLPQTRRSLDTRMDAEQLKTACVLINTADYCQTTALELEEKIKEKIRDDLKEKVSLQDERDIFVGVISATIVIQLRELENACEAAFSAMARTSWGTISQVSGPSAYVADLEHAMESVAAILEPRVEQKKYLRNFFDKGANLILTRFTNALVKSRPLKEIGAEQSLIDLQAVKAALLKLPGDHATSIYSKNVTRTTTNLEALLKVIVTSIDPAEGFILNYTIQIGDDSFSNFQKVLDLKGTPKTDQNHLLDNFVAITSTMQDLQPTSFLSALDMNPPSTVYQGSSQAAAPSSSMTPSGSRVNLPALLAGTGAGEGILAALGSPPLSGPPTGDGVGRGEAAQKPQVFQSLKGFMHFGLRRDTAPP